jgi:hypothetical protein
MPSLAFRTTMTAAADEVIHIEIYSVADDGATTVLLPGDNPVDWAGLLDSTTVTSDSLGYNFSSTGPATNVVTATIGQASASFTLRWTPRALRFTAAAVLPG